MEINPQIIKDLEKILLQRSKDHGSFKKNSKDYHEIKSQVYKTEISKKIKPEDLMAIDMIVLKLIRIKENNLNPDNWIDIIGYAINRLNALYKGGKFD